MKTLLPTVLAIFWISSAHACSPPMIGDQFHFENGPVLEVVKTIECSKICVRPVGSKQSCHLINDPRLYDPKRSNAPETWIILYGEKQSEDLN